MNQENYYNKAFNNTITGKYSAHLTITDITTTVNTMQSNTIVPSDYQYRQAAIVAYMGTRRCKLPTAFSLDPEEYTDLTPTWVPNFSEVQE